MSTIKANISYQKSYDIHVGQGLEERFESYCRDHYSLSKIFVVIDENVDSLHEKRVQDMVSFFDEAYIINIPEGESSKAVDKWNKIVDRVLQIGAERGTPLLAIGGGVTGDLGGFVAATVLRGLPLIHMPTSLLAMVDSSIGGKTGVNHSTGKNLVGSFYQPDAVFADTAFLETLEQREWITGMAEILKYAAIRNPALFDELETLVQQPLEPNAQWTDIIRGSAQIKVDIVQEDTLEAGKRAFLNFGHTFGHALEKAAGYGELAHGEAVFAGMIAATEYSKHLGHPVDNIRFKPFLTLYQQQITGLPDDIDELIEIMQTDKKVKNNTLRLILLNDWASPYIYPCEDYELLHEVWKFTLSQFNKDAEHV